jgi:hypothetical protein
MRIYKKAQQERKFYEGDIVEASFNGKKYVGEISNYIDNERQYFIRFNDLDSVQEMADGIDSTRNPNAYNRIYDIMEWMESPIEESDITLVKKGKRWELVKSDMQLSTYEFFMMQGQSWDVRKAKRIIFEKPRETTQFPVDSVKYCLTNGSVNVGGDYKSADLSIPIILTSTKGDSVSGQFPIDGWHRIAKAIELGVEFIPAYVLSPEENKEVQI